MVTTSTSSPRIGDWTGLSIQIEEGIRPLLLSEGVVVLQYVHITPMGVLPVIAASTYFYGGVCWRNGISGKAKKKYDNVIMKASIVIWVLLEPLEAIYEQRTLSKLLVIIDNTARFLYQLMVQSQQLDCVRSHRIVVLTSYFHYYSSFYL